MDSLRRRLLLTTAFLFLLSLLPLMREPFSTAMRQALPFPYRSEYSLAEQAGKYLLLVGLGVATCLYRAARRRRAVRLSVGYLLLCVALYGVESNFIEGSSRFWLIGPLFAWVALATCRAGSMAVLWVAAGGAALLAGELGDQRYAEWLARQEEFLETAGIGLITLSTIWVAFDELMRVVRRNLAGIVALQLCFAFITAGNSFLHWQYHPQPKVVAIAAALSALGCLGIYLVNRAWLPAERRLELLDARGFYACLAGFFIVLPVTYHRPSEMVSAAVWLGGLLWLGSRLVRGARRPSGSSRRGSTLGG